MKKLPASLRLHVLSRDKFACQAGLPNCAGKDGLEPHHMKFRSRGGSDDPVNLVSLCRNCHDKVHAHFLGTGRWRTFSWQDEGYTEDDEA